MASGDFIDVEAGDALAILKYENAIMSGTYDFSMDQEGDFSRSNCEFEYKEQTEETTKFNEQTSIPNTKIEKEKKLGHRRVHTDGGVSYKKIHTSKIMDSIQLGIQRCVGGLATTPERDVLMIDFMTVESTSFTVHDDVLSASHSSEFIFKTYAPEAFRHFRVLFGIKSANFVSSFCNAPLVELPNPGASGSVFYLTHNDEFITKTVHNREAAFLQKLLPGYYLNLNQNPNTLLPKFFGLYCYKCNSRNVRLLVMNNVLPSSVEIHQKYDLKGSTYKRKSSAEECEKSSPTFKDLDFIDHHPEGIFLDTDVYKALIKTIQRDCRVLESFQIIDYSLLVGIHSVDRVKSERGLVNKGQETQSNEDTNNVPSGDGNADVQPKINNIMDSETQRHSRENTPISSYTKHASFKHEMGNNLEGWPARRANGEQILIFVGIIDILQSYRVKKKLEHLWKSILHDGDTVSVHNPGFYAQRFQEFMSNRVFKAAPSITKEPKKKKITALDIMGEKMP